MATTRLSRRRNGEGFLPEMSSGQQVIGICVFLFIAVVCFALGVLVGRYEPSIEEKALSQLGARAENAPAVTGSGTQVSPRVDTAPTAEREPAREIAPAARGPVTRPEERTGPRVTELPPLPSPAARQTASAAPSAAVQQPPAEPADPAPAPVPAPAVVPPPAAPPAPAPVSAPAPAPGGMTQQTLDRELLAALDPPLPATPPPPATPKPPAPTPTTALPAPAPAPSGTTQGWAVQFGWFSGEGHLKRAENMRDQVRAKAKLEAAVVPSADKKEHRVVVFYKDKATAQNAAAQLRKTPDFKDVFVKELP